MVAPLGGGGSTGESPKARASSQGGPKLAALGVGGGGGVLPAIPGNEGMYAGAECLPFNGGTEPGVKGLW